MNRTPLLALLALLLAGCGQKGPLYLPPPEPEEGAEAPAPAQPAQPAQVPPHQQPPQPEQY